MKILPEAVTTQAAAAMEAVKQARLAKAAQQFEAMLLQEMLKPMRSGEDSWGGDGGGLDGSGNPDSSSNPMDFTDTMDTISGFGTEAVAAAIAKDGGFGIARQVIQQVTLEHQRDMEKKSRSTKV
jgi:Rod binding domain-containing protein